ncbi:hypothetical protein IWX49DRAFT_541923 [Phyllosticta citricarpa]|uniref:Calcium channel YVC1-like C-terminal transmembrane domain-containing protein n=2 Tax=Phyllosticta TaxID=121621 RepID=A0ABR1M6J3_9PEZI
MELEQKPTLKVEKPLPPLPEIRNDDNFSEIASKLSIYFIEAIDSPVNFKDLNQQKWMKRLQPLIDYLSKESHHPALVASLLALKGHFDAVETEDDRGIDEARGHACELVAWQFVLSLSEREAIDFLLWELKPFKGITPDPDDVDSSDDEHDHDPEAGHSNGRLSTESATERTALLGGHTPANGKTNGTAASGKGKLKAKAKAMIHPQHEDIPGNEYDAKDGDSFAEPFLNLNALEIAVVSEAKKFLCQRVVQEIINGIWYGDIVFWERLTINAAKKPSYHNKAVGDPWCRLRVPRYMKSFEMAFFLAMLALFFVVSLERELWSITAWEVLFYVFIAGYACDEWIGFKDAGARFYATDLWSLLDILIILNGLTFFVLRVIGLSTNSAKLLDIAFSVLALQSLFLTPRIFSLLSLSPYYGTLLPCMAEMGKQFIKFLSFALIIDVGFFSTFVLLARGNVSLYETTITTLKVFFGAGVVGFDLAPRISHYFGLPVMVIFVGLTNMLIMQSMLSYINNSLRQVLETAHEEYAFGYAVYVLESSTSDRLTYFFPPLNLVPLVLSRPLQVVLPQTLSRKLRIVLLKCTHVFHMAVIWIFEKYTEYMYKKNVANLPAGNNPMNGKPASAKRTSTRISMGRKVNTSLMKAPRTMPTAASSKQGVGRSVTTTSTLSSSGTVQVPINPSETMALLGKLSETVEQLKAQVARQQKQQGQGQ